MNTGTIIGDKYIKQVNFSKAVLWMSKEISLNPAVARNILRLGVKTIIFKDRIKGEKWSVSIKQARKHATLKQVGQEKQYYIPVEIFKKEKI